MKTLTITIMWLGASVCATAFSSRQLEARHAEHRYAKDAGSEVMYLPNGTGLNLISFGYKNAVSGILWLNTVSYFGKHYASDQQYTWLNHMCNLVTALNPKVYEPYYFCSTMLAWELGKPAAAIEILSSAMTAHPDDWFFPYLRGFYSLYFMKNPDAAKNDFIIAAGKPGAHPIASRLAAKTISQLDDPAMAIAFLKSMIQSSHDDFQRSALQQKLDVLEHSHGAAAR